MTTAIQRGDSANGEVEGKKARPRGARSATAGTAVSRTRKPKAAAAVKPAAARKTSGVKKAAPAKRVAAAKKAPAANKPTAAKTRAGSTKPAAAKKPAVAKKVAAAKKPATAKRARVSAPRPVPLTVAVADKAQAPKALRKKPAAKARSAGKPAVPKVASKPKSQVPTPARTLAEVIAGWHENNARRATEKAGNLPGRAKRVRAGVVTTTTAPSLLSLDDPPIDMNLVAEVAAKVISNSTPEKAQDKAQAPLAADAPRGDSLLVRELRESVTKPVEHQLDGVFAREAAQEPDNRFDGGAPFGRPQSSSRNWNPHLGHYGVPVKSTRRAAG
jgi:hypothetical protein